MKFKIDREKLGRALELVKEIELHLELLRSCHTSAFPTLKIVEQGEDWVVSFERYQDKISQSGTSPGEALDKLLVQSVERMESILSLQKPNKKNK